MDEHSLAPEHLGQTFLPSDVLHSKDVPSALCNSSPSDGEHHVIICHKDRRSFYKSTRKARRTAERIWRSFVGSSCPGRKVVASDGYYIGNDRPLCSFDGQGSHCSDSAMHQRLSAAFGNQPGKNIALGVPNVAVEKFSATDLRGVKDSGLDRLNVIYFDLDAITRDCDDSTTAMDNGSDQKIHFDLMQNILTILIRKMDNSDRNCTIHVRSDAMYRVAVGAGPTCLSGAEMEHALLSMGDKSDALDNIPSTSKGVIRRLRHAKGAANCPLTIHPARFVELLTCSNNGDRTTTAVEICRFHNYDERGCLRSKRALRNPEVKGCDMDHLHCHRCGGEHRALECPNPEADNTSSVAFRISEDGGITAVLLNGNENHRVISPDIASLPALLVLGGRLRGRTLATCEMLPLTSCGTKERKWTPLPNLSDHRGSHAACSPVGSGLVFVLGGGTADGNSDAVESLDFGSRQMKPYTENDAREHDSRHEVNGEWRWHTMEGKLSSPRHAFGAVSCRTSKEMSLFAVGGWKYGSMSCESLERLTLPLDKDFDWRGHRESCRWELCAPLLLPRRLHSVASSADGSSIYVFGGYIDERRTTSSIERYDVSLDEWSVVGNLPYGESCPLVQAIADGDSFLVFPFSTEHVGEDQAPSVMRYTPCSDTPFTPAIAPDDSTCRRLCLPLTNWHSFSATSSTSLNKAFLVGGTINGKWTDRCFELDMVSLKWKELPAMTFARRRLATLVLE
ncbi:hypothetical protein ACHAWF_012587 [Thalassiosira exigua]